MTNSEIWTRIAKDLNDLSAGGSEDVASRIQLFGDLSTMFSLLAATVATKLVNVNYTASYLDSTVRVDATSGARTITLPAAASVTGLVLTFKKTDGSANTVTIDANAAEVIDGALTKVLNTQYQSLSIQSNGTSWDII